MSLIKNSALNFVGFIIPTMVAIPSLGILARILGTEKFGLFTLVFAIVGYASIFDAGLTRAVIREISLHRNNNDEQKKIISTSVISIAVLGCLAAMLIYFFSPSISLLLKVSSINSNDANTALQVLSLSIPFFLLNQIWLAYLEGYECFSSVNIQKIIGNSCIATFPAIFSYYSPTLTFAVWGLFWGRMVSLFISLFFTRKIVFGSGFLFSYTVFIRLIKFGGWMTVSNIISPLMVYFDRFIISNTLGATYVAYYSAPAEGVNRILNIPNSLARALFPKLSGVVAERDKIKLERLSYLIILASCIPIVALGIAYAKYIMLFWMGAEYLGEPVVVLRILLIGLLFNSLAQIPFVKIQAKGSSKTTAFLHLAEVVPYLFLIFFMSKYYGLIGVALSWTIRVVVDFFILFYFSKK